MKKIGIIVKEGADNHKIHFSKLIAFLEKEKKQIVSDIKKCDLLVVFGGDGTILKTMQLLDGAKTPILGVNTGGLGILTQIKPEKLTQNLKKIFAGQYKKDKRTMLEVKINGKKFGLALNEVSVDQCAFTRLICFEISIDHEKIKFCADGVIVATPQGSTGHSYSAGGHIIKRNQNLFAITPICPAGRKQKPLIVKADSKIKIRLNRYHNDANGMGLSLDGQKNANITYKTKIDIQKSRNKAIFAVPSLSRR